MESLADYCETKETRSLDHRKPIETKPPYLPIIGSSARPGSVGAGRKQEIKLIRTTTTLATLLMGVTLSTAAVGGEVANGRMANGISLNGIELNGRWLNSLSFNEMRVRGTQISGARMPGRPRDDKFVNFDAGSVVIEAIKLPANG